MSCPLIGLGVDINRSTACSLWALRGQKGQLHRRILCNFCNRQRERHRAAWPTEGTFWVFRSAPQKPYSTCQGPLESSQVGITSWTGPPYIHQGTTCEWPSRPSRIHLLLDTTAWPHSKPSGAHMPSWALPGALLDLRKWFPRGAAVPTQHSKDVHTLKNGGETYSGIAHSHFVRGGKNTYARKIVSLSVLRNMEKDSSLSVIMPIIWHSNTTSAIQLLVSHKRWVKTLMSFVKREKEVENPSHKDPLWLKIQGKQY